MLWERFHAKKQNKTKAKKQLKTNKTQEQLGYIYIYKKKNAEEFVLDGVQHCGQADTLGHSDIRDSQLHFGFSFKLESGWLHQTTVSSLKKKLN